MAISNFNGTTAKSFKIGDITIYSGLTPYNYEGLGKDGDIFISTDGTRYSKADGRWQIQMNEWSGTEIPDNTLGENGDLFRLLSSDGVSGSKYIKVNDDTTEPVGLKWMTATKELYSNLPNDELFADLDYYITPTGDYVKIDGHWIKIEQKIIGTEFPQTAIGNNGDIYHDTLNNNYYYKSEGKWYNITRQYIQTDTPNSDYGVNNDIWVGATNNDVYVREVNNWNNKTENNQVSGGNGKIIGGFYPEKSIISVFSRTYYVKLEDGWHTTSKIYHAESIPAYYHGDNGNICLNNQNSLVWVKENNIWNVGSLVGLIAEAPSADYGDLYTVVYTQSEKQYITNDSSVYLATNKNNSTMPTDTDGSVGDIYTIGSTNYYKNNNNEWLVLGNSYNFQSTPLPCETDDLNNYLYVVDKETPETYICNNREWNLIGNTINCSTAPSGFAGSQYDIYITYDELNGKTYYVYDSDWIETTLKTYESEPDSSCGVDYDIYQMGDIKYAKINDEWVNITAGTTLVGSGEPDNNIGDVNDLYINEDNNELYIKIEIDLWQLVSNTYNNEGETPPNSFWDIDTIYINNENKTYVKSSSGWELTTNIYDASNSTPPNNYWFDYTIFETTDKKYIRYNNSWNEILGTLHSLEEPNIYMWSIGTLYNNSTNNYIKVSNNLWVVSNGSYNSNDKPQPTYWGTGVIYTTPTRKYINTNGTWENVLNEETNYSLPNNNYGQNGMVWLTLDYNYYLRINSVWKRVSNVFDKNVAPKYNSFGLEKSMYQLANGNAFVKQNSVWNLALDIIEGEEEPFDDVGEIGTIFEKTEEGEESVLYALNYDYSWTQIRSTYTPEDNPLDSDGEYLWLYIKSDTEMVYKNQETWVTVSGITKSTNQPTEADGEENNVWITLSTGLYVKDSGEWAKILTSGLQELNARQEIYLFT